MSEELRWSDQRGGDYDPTSEGHIDGGLQMSRKDARAFRLLLQRLSASPDLRVSFIERRSGWRRSTFGFWIAGPMHAVDPAVEQLQGFLRI